MTVCGGGGGGGGDNDDDDDDDDDNDNDNNDRWQVQNPKKMSELLLGSSLTWTLVSDLTMANTKELFYFNNTLFCKEQ